MGEKTSIAVKKVQHVVSLEPPRTNKNSESFRGGAKRRASSKIEQHGGNTTLDAEINEAAVTLLWIARKRLGGAIHCRSMMSHSLPNKADEQKLKSKTAELTNAREPRAGFFINSDK
jgi:hypothetical protein